MKYPVYPHTAIGQIPADADSILLVRPIKADSLLKIIRKIQPREIFLPDSCAKRLSSKVKKILQEQGVELKLSKHRGRAIELEPIQLKQVIDLYRDDKTYREISALTGIPKSTVHYLIKYANRDKIKMNNRTVYL